VKQSDLVVNFGDVFELICVDSVILQRSSRAEWILRVISSHLRIDLLRSIQEVDFKQLDWLFVFFQLFPIIVHFILIWVFPGSK
jgi:hypothetical protein